jgi:hypothetical protein
MMRTLLTVVVVFLWCVAANAEHTPEQIAKAESFSFAGIGWTDEKTCTRAHFVKLYPRATTDKRPEQRADIGPKGYSVNIGTGTLSASYIDGQLAWFGFSERRKGNPTSAYQQHVELFGEPDEVLERDTLFRWHLGGKTISLRVAGPGVVWEGRAMDVKLLEKWRQATGRWDC